ncbi:hypothetical protein H8959_016274 [Pygathrix nigripes]
MFDGEVANLEALQGTGLVRALRSMKVIDLPRGGATFVMEHLKMRSLSRLRRPLVETAVLRIIPLLPIPLLLLPPPVWLLR